MNKKGQWAHALSRQIRSGQREERVLLAYMLLQEKKSKEYIAVQLGVSTTTIQQYIAEINADKQHFKIIYQKRIQEIKELEKQRIKRLSRTNNEIIGEEFVSSIKFSSIFCVLALLWWWIPSILWFIINSGKNDITKWIYSVQGFIIFLIVFTIFIFIIKYSNAKKEINDYNYQKKICK